MPTHNSGNNGHILRTLDDLPIDGKRVIVRVDFNINVGTDGVIDENEDYRIEAALPTIYELQQRRCKVLVLTHLGRPGEEDGNFDVTPIRHRFEDLLKEDVRELAKLSGNGVEAVVTSMEPGSVAMYPNIRIEDREMSVNQRFGQELAAVAEAYVNEAFSVSHRTHTSVALLPQLLPSCAGRRTTMEVEKLLKLKRNPQHPYVAIVSGAKITTKVGMLRQLLAKVDTLCVGGQIGNVFVAAKGLWKHHPFDVDEIVVAKAILDAAGGKLLIPVDVVIGGSKGENKQVVSVDQIPEDAGGLWDIGPQSTQAIINACSTAKSVMWNGPLGMFEVEAYADSTHQLVTELSKMSAYRVVGGGDTAHALELYRATKKYDHVSVGGGAMVAFLEGKRMPGLEPLMS
ncbi:MAG: phosphoglycerate kinase [Candidatus Andersenbacteria bacterium]